MQVDEIRSLLSGSFRGSGRGGYPTVSSFEYFETIDLEPSPKGFIEYRSRTRSKVDGSPLHTECGYIRVISPERAELIVAQPTGIAEVACGTIESIDGELVVSFEAIPSVSSTAKVVSRTARELRFGVNRLSYSFTMETDTVEMTWHLSAQLDRIGGEG
ncbi:MAG: FABP family protein [Actinomycetota bacterium]|nr:FABP family protein [Actinomycetota bacterium]